MATLNTSRELNAWSISKYEGAIDLFRPPSEQGHIHALPKSA